MLDECAGLVHARGLPVDGLKALDTSAPQSQAISNAHEASSGTCMQTKPPPSIYREAEADMTPLRAPMDASLTGFFSPHYVLGRNKADALIKTIPSNLGEPC